tara:strand:+ start:186 stop:554 length:369 start_codon:yes stop_codon:yes gene_type:complete
MNDKQYKNITEVSELLKIQKHIIRYWDSIDKKTNKLRIDGLSTRLAGSKRRHFSKENIKNLEQLKNVLYKNGNLNYSLDLAKKIVNKNYKLNSSNSAPNNSPKNLDIDQLLEISNNLKKLIK